MSNLGTMVMLNMLSGEDRGVELLKAQIGKTIDAVELTEKELRLTMGDGVKLTLWDDGQSCCENRYMRTDDTLADFVGATLAGVELRDVDQGSSEDYVDDVQFLLVQTSKGALTIANHNEHNGYYGGFWIRAKLSE